MEIVEKFLTLAGVLVTALATFALWRATRVLATETKRLVEATSEPQVVASIEANQWTMMHADLRVANTGNATAFDITIAFDPPLVVELETMEKAIDTPLQNISLLKPGQERASWIGKIFPLLERTYSVTIEFARRPRGPRETVSYQLDMASYKGIHRLGANDPLTLMAERLKKLQEDFHRVAIGSQNLSVDVFTSADRTAEREALETRWTAEREDAQR